MLTDWLRQPARYSSTRYCNCHLARATGPTDTTTGAFVARSTVL